MATDKPRFTITLDQATLDKVLDYKDQKKLATQSKAIQNLIKMGIEQTGTEDAEPPKKYTRSEDPIESIVLDSGLPVELVPLFRKISRLDPSVQEKIVKLVESIADSYGGK